MKKKYKINDYTLLCEITTRWRDLDAFQHVNNAVYATYIESYKKNIVSKNFIYEIIDSLSITSE